MRFCEANGCNYPVFSTDKVTRKGYCKSHANIFRTDLDKRSIVQKAMSKEKSKRIASKLRQLPENIEGVEKIKGKKILYEVDEQLEKWFADRRKEMKGFCSCGCGKPSSKNDDKYFKFSAAHLFPKSKFPSIKYHKMNWVERAFFGGCHSQMDDTSMNRWVKFADWEDIKDKFHLLAELLTDEERATKFYSHFEKLIYG